MSVVNQSGNQLALKNLHGKTVVVGADGKVIKHWKRVARAADHADKVLQVLNAA